MAGQHGGYRKPANPAPVSGPGKYSKRTDGQAISTAPDQAYGDAKQQAMAQRVQPLASAGPPPTPEPPGSAAMSAPPYQGGDFMAPSARPDEPITHGVDIGPGAGPEALNLPAVPTGPQGNGYLTGTLSQLSGMDATGILGTLAAKAAAVNA
jgi:hypothetical protein